MAQTEKTENANAKTGVKVPTALRFPLCAILSLALSSLVYGVLAGYEGTAAAELAGVSRKLEGWAAVGGVLSWRVSELALAWFAGYDGYDIVSLSLLSHGPPVSIQVPAWEMYLDLWFLVY